LLIDDDQIPNLETPFFKFRGDFTNDSAHEFEAQSIRAIIAERQQQLDRVEHEMSGLKAVADTFNGLYEQLGEKRDKINQSMNSHKGLISPLRRLPDEILSLIFIHCLPEDSHLSLVKNKAPVLLTRICRQWRNIALDMPRLWCRPHLKLKNRRHLHQQDNLYHLCLERSRGRPLSLVIDCYANQMPKLRKFLQPYGHHISSLSIPSVRGTCEVFREFPALLELALNNTTSRTSLTITTCIKILPPTVRSLKVTGSFSLDRDSSAIPAAALAHLTHIEVSLCSLGVVIRLIRLSSNLSSLVIHQYISERIPATDSAQVLTHTTLRSLRILEANTSVTSLLPSLFSILSLPKLRILEVSGSQAWPHEEVKAFLERSNCPLEDLIFGARMVTTDEQRAEYVALIPSLVVTHFA
jgi:hypothetical protein